MAVCRQCSKEYTKHRASKGSFCSRICYWSSMKGKVAFNGYHHIGWKHTDEWKSLMRQKFKGRKCPKMSGENHPNWIKDRTKVKLGDRSLHDPLTKQWRKQVKDRDNWSCRIADKNCDGKLEVHHILRWSEFPELRYEINNGITLCHAHHPLARAEEKRLIPTFMELVSVSK